MTAAAKYVPHYTVADYERWEGLWELWLGVAVAMSPAPSPRHQQVAAQVAASLLEAIKAAGCKDCSVLPETDWEVAADTVVRPDIAIHCGPLPPARLVAPPQLIVEVLSPSTAAKDRDAKRRLYAQQGVPYYLLVEPLSEPSAPLVEVLQLELEAYRPFPAYVERGFTLHADCTIRPQLFAAEA